MEKGSVPSIGADSGTTFGVGRPEDLLIQTGKNSGKISSYANGSLAKSTEVAEVEHDLRPLAWDMHVTPGIRPASLSSTGKYANANYASLFLKDRVDVFDLENTFFVPKEAVMRGHKCRGGLYRMPLQAEDAKALDPLPNLDNIMVKKYNTKNNVDQHPALT